MTVTPTTTQTPTASLTPSSSGTDSASSLKSLTNNYDTFLNLLVTQLKNQDPLSPMDSNQFTQQLVQFSSVEQQIQQNKNLETLISAQTQNGSAAAVGYIGRTVSATSDSIGLSGGKATINYALNDDVADNLIVVSDSSGKTIRALTGETGKGAHSITWDGKDSQGNQLADGVYKISLSAANADKTTATGSIGLSGIVTGVSMVDQKPMLAIGGVTVPVENVLSVSGSAGT